MKNRKAFTLVEIITVVTIMGLMIGAVVSIIGSSRVRGRDARRVADINLIAEKLQNYYVEHKEYPLSLSQLDNYAALPTDPRASSSYYYDYQCVDSLISQTPADKILSFDQGLINKITAEAKNIAGGIK